MGGILLLLIVLAYAGAVDEHGTQKQADFWGNKATSRAEVERVDYVITPQNVQRFGYRFGSEK